MARLPLDSFLPSGAISDPNEYPLSYAKQASGVSPYSVISPLALPRSLSQASYFDESHQLVSQAHHRSLLTATNGAGGVPSQLPTSHPQQRQPRPSDQQPRQNYPQHHQERYLSPHRSSSGTQDRSAMSPTRSQISGTGSGLVSPSLTPFDGLSSPEHIALQLRRVTLQNRRLLENWEAERAHLEANRGRAEEIYKEERAIMDEERLVWAEAEAQYKNRVWQLEQENQELRNRLDQQGTGRSEPVPDIRGGGSESSEMMGSPSSGENPAVKFQSFSPAVSPGSVPSGRTMPASDPFVPLDPRLQSMSPPNGSGGSGTPSQEHIPSIDVQEIHPQLEGIPLKMPAVKKATFTDGSSSRKESPTDSNSDSPAGGKSKTSPAEVTQKTLRAPEQARLTMHAGHTPNHSISLLSTAASTIVPNTADSSGAATPVQESSGAAHPEFPSATQPSTNDIRQNGYDLDEEEEEDRQLFEPSDDDRPLAGPLMLRNMPAKDEIFLQRLEDKLNDSINSNDATPTVLKGNMGEPEGPAQREQSENVPAEGGSDSNTLGDDEPSDIPLKLKSTRNFGAPLGSIGNTGF
ncbi:hypothetical protein PG985_011249 [Apiospora marii]|uniref:BZIP domain-containing protein n=1 Tax=Apiospora marii TaxID=335849 RepID=A0ABR1SVG2_9PEZI